MPSPGGRRAESHCATLADEEAALARSTSSAGVHFSFEKLDHVTRSTICGALPAGCWSEQQHHRHELVAFAITDEMLASAREMVSGESEAERAAAAAEAEREKSEATKRAMMEAAERVKAEAAAEHHRRVKAKREAGKERQQQQRQK